MIAFVLVVIGCLCLFSAILIYFAFVVGSRAEQGKPKPTKKFKVSRG